MIGAVTGKTAFSTADKIWEVKGERWDEKKDQDIANDVKLQGIISYYGTFKNLIFVHSKHSGDWLRLQDTNLTVTVLSIEEFCNFYVMDITLTPLTLKINAMVY